jgi:hypothetical protein
MALHSPVPSETDPTSIVDLVNDCREVASVLGHSAIDLTVGITKRVAQVPLARMPLDRLPFSFGAMPVEITEDLLVTVNGLDDY